MKKVAVIMGSDSDFPVVSKAVAELKAYGSLRMSRYVCSQNACACKRFC